MSAAGYETHMEPAPDGLFHTYFMKF